MGLGKNAIALPAGAWTNIVAVDGTLASVQVVVQNDGYKNMQLVWGGADPGVATKGLLLEPGEADYDTADSIWCHPGSKAGRVRVSTR